MNEIELATQKFNEENYNEAENISLNILEKNPENMAAIDVLAAIYLKTENLELLNKATKKELFLIRKIAEFLNKLQTYEQAIVFYKKALELEPKDAVGLNNIALAYEEINKTDLAKEAYEKSIKIKENYSAIYNLGVLERKNKNIDKSIKLLKKAQKLNPTNPYANYSLGMSYLMQKDFKKGYPYFLKRPIQYPEELKNFWRGQKEPNKTLLVYCEYGYGDALMFSRYFPLLKNFFKEVKVLCPSNLKTLFENSFKEISFYSNIKEVTFDYCVFSMDLPYYLKLDFDNIPNPDNYLIADKNKTIFFKENYFNNNNYKVGICYIGGELTKRNAQYRAIELALLEKLFSLPNIQFYSFQKDDVFGELENYPQLINLGKTFNNFSDTAAAMKNLDLFISIDSAPAHLAGALGTKTLLMLPYYSEWRWFLQEETKSPWYNSVELIRQSVPANWNNVVENIYEQLKTLSN